jgi:hypothetical protein
MLAHVAPSTRPAWAVESGELRAVIGADLSLPTVIQSIVESDRSWKAVDSFYENIIMQKEAAESDTEITTTLSIRRKRVGWRMLAFIRSLLQPLEMVWERQLQHQARGWCASVPVRQTSEEMLFCVFFFASIGRLFQEVCC